MSHCIFHSIHTHAYIQTHAAISFKLITVGNIVTGLIRLYQYPPPKNNKKQIMMEEIIIITDTVEELMLKEAEEIKC
jgi:hypothetical protein